MKQTQKEALSLMREVLQEELLELHVRGYRLEENFTDPKSMIFLSVTNEVTGESMPIEGVGVGIVDAAFRGLRQRLASEYPSLNSISFSAFEVEGLMSSGHEALADAEARVKLGVRNSYDNEFSFESQSRSVGQACIEAVLQAVCYFVNSERAFVTMYKARKHYEEKGRHELVSKYTGLLSKMVANTSYSEVLDRLKAEM